MHSFSFTPLIQFDKPFDWKDISKEPNLNEEFLLEHAAELDWKQISRHNHLSSSFIEKEIHRFHMYELAKNPFVQQQQLTFDTLQQLYRQYWDCLISIEFIGLQPRKSMTRYIFSMELDPQTFPKTESYETILLSIGFFGGEFRQGSISIELIHEETSITSYTSWIHNLCSNSYQLQAIHFLLDELVKTYDLTEDFVFSY